MMVFKRRQSWVQLMFRINGSVLPRIWKRLFITTGFAALIALIQWSWGTFSHSLSLTPFTIIALALGIFLGFRNNTSYDRFWEGRKLWGRLINTSRTFTRQLHTLVNGPDDEAEEVEEFRRVMVRRTAAFAHATRLHLRDQVDFSQLGRLVTEEEAATFDGTINVPGAILLQSGKMLTGAWKRGWINDLHLPLLEASLADYTGMQSGCERIKTTPIPFSHTMLMHRIVGFYCLALPFGIVDTVGLMTPLVILLVSYSFFGLDAIGEEIENPFGFDTHDLPLLYLSTKIEREALARIGADDIPAAIEPRSNVLS